MNFYGTKFKCGDYVKSTDNYIGWIVGITVNREVVTYKVQDHKDKWKHQFILEEDLFLTDRPSTLLKFRLRELRLRELK